MVLWFVREYHHALFEFSDFGRVMAMGFFMIMPYIENMGLCPN
jgi:hypothetical protein